VLFTFFYSFVQVNPEKMAENLQKQGSYIPSVRPGKGTEKYVSRLLMRLATVGALFLGLISIIPIAAQNVWGLPKIVALGGTSLLILIQVAIQAVKQLEGYLLKRKYAGFMDNPLETK
jgi:preprotein translocase subunit SecY